MPWRRPAQNATTPRRDSAVLLGVLEGEFGAELERSLRARSASSVITTSSAQVFEVMLRAFQPEVVAIDSRLVEGKLASTLDLIRLMAPDAHVVVLIDSRPQTEDDVIYLSREKNGPESVARTIDKIVRLDAR